MVKISSCRRHFVIKNKKLNPNQLMCWNLFRTLLFVEEKPRLTLASVTLNSLRMYWGMLYSAMGSTTKYWYLAERSAGQYWWHFSCEGET